MFSLFFDFFFFFSLRFFQKNLWTVNYKKKLYSIIIAKTLENNRVIIIYFFFLFFIQLSNRFPFLFLLFRVFQNEVYSRCTIIFCCCFFFQKSRAHRNRRRPHDCNTPIFLFTRGGHKCYRIVNKMSKEKKYGWNCSKWYILWSFWHAALRDFYFYFR